MEVIGEVFRDQPVFFIFWTIIMLIAASVIVLVMGSLGMQFNKKPYGFSTRKSREKESMIQKVSFLSTGLAIGYYYNFLHKFCSNREVKLSIGKGSFKYDCRDVKIYIVLPRQISDAHLQYAQQYNAGFNEEGKFTEGVQGFYRIKSKGETGIEIIDFPTTIKVLKYYVDDLKGNVDKEQLLRLELENFQRELRKLVKDNHYEARINLFFVDHQGNPI